MTLKTSQPLIKLKQIKVLSNSEIAPSVFVLSFLRDFEFEAGQVIGIGMTPSDDARLYSICSGKDEDKIRILYNVKPEGKLTPTLSVLKAADHIYISPPFGSYYGTEKPAYWIAAGTGLAPFYSMYRSNLGKNKTLLHGGRKLDSFYFSDELTAYFGEKYIRCSSVEEAPGIYKGRVTQYLQDMNDLPLNEMYFLCGSAEMVVDCREILLSKGVPFDNIVAEIYF
jgi:ferredoxin/flavodoxin---NADP+ reductase